VVRACRELRNRGNVLRFSASACGNDGRSSQPHLLLPRGLPQQCSLVRFRQELARRGSGHAGTRARRESMEGDW
jgi:hypothetical protein